MSEDLKLPSSNVSKANRYEVLIPQIEALISGESDMIANLANIAAALKEGMEFLWVGFYCVKKNMLVLGPFQGPPACTRIPFGKGVCGTAWKEARSIIVPDVKTFPGHIACSSRSQSEIVLPVFNGKDVAMILDVDSEKNANFDKVDEQELQKVIGLVERLIKLPSNT